MNGIIYITCSLPNIHFVHEICVQHFLFNYIKLLSNKGHYPDDRCQMMILLWSFKCKVFGNYLIESWVVTNTLIDMALHVSPSTDKGSSFVAQN